MRYTVEVEQDEDGKYVETRWYKEGTNILHREDGPALERTNGTKIWYKNGLCHRVDGPAAIYSDGDKYWFVNNKLHREDGPAVEYAKGKPVYYLDGVRYTKEQFEQLTVPNLEQITKDVSKRLGYEVKIVRV